MSLTGPATGSQTHTFKPRLIFKDLVLAIVNLALEEVDLLIEDEDDVLHGLAIHLEITGKVRDHEVIGIEATLNHPLAPEDLLLHSFKPSLHGSRPLGAGHTAKVKHPLMHLNGLVCCTTSRKYGLMTFLKNLSLEELEEAMVDGI